MSLTKIVQCVGIFVKNGQIILGEKRRGLGTGSLNGLGGNFEAAKGDKTTDDTMLREPYEEARVTPRKIEKMGIVNFNFEGKRWYVELHVYKIDEFDGHPVDVPDSDLGNPRFYPIANLDYNRMWGGDRVWLPMLLQGKKFAGRGLYKTWDNLIEHDIHEVSSL
jgi:8-oxo-dGTP pyrophosphatase MutT (NUDIX family)